MELETQDRRPRADTILCSLLMALLLVSCNDETKLGNTSDAQLKDDAGEDGSLPDGNLSTLDAQDVLDGAVRYIDGGV